MKINLNEIKDTSPKRNHGDIKGLKQSIAEIGLINPITINQNNKLLAGRRRFQAIKELGWIEVDCQVLNSKNELFDFKVAIDENIQRKPLTRAENKDSLKAYDKLKKKLNV